MSARVSPSASLRNCCAALRDRAVVDPFDLEQLVAVGDESLFMGGRTGAVHERHHLMPDSSRSFSTNRPSVVVAEHRRERDLGAGGLHVLGDHRGAAGVTPR